MPKPNDWIYFAIDDLDAAKTLFKMDVSPAAIFYHCQQSAEKSLKAYLNFKVRPLYKTHDLEFLSDECIKLDSDFLSIKADALDLNPYAWATRYPDDFYVFPSLDTAKICIQKAELILEFVKNKIENI